MATRSEQIREEGLSKITQIIDLGINPYPAEPPQRTHFNALLKNTIDREINENVWIVGRIASIREHGKYIFMHIHDESGEIQCMIEKDQADRKWMMLFERNLIGLGDHININGTATRTRRGEPTVVVEDLKILSKSILPPPQTKGEIVDPELSRRQRYLPLMFSTEERTRFEFRSKMKEYMRQYFITKLGGVEVDTPILDTVYGGANARPFTTRYNDLGQDVYLRISNELPLKKLTVAGYETVFEFASDFRNEGRDRTHSPEFQQVELYKAYVDYFYMMNMMEDLMSSIARDLLGKTKITYQGKEIDLTPPWDRLSIYDGLKKYAKIDPETLPEKKVRNFAKKHGIDDADYGHVLVELFEKFAEPKLTRPTFVMDFPASTSPLTKLHRINPNLAERFEVLIPPMEVANCYTELNDPRLQKSNFDAQVERMKRGDSEAMPLDEDFIKAMEYGMPPQAGIGISIDRWVMLFMDLYHIRDATFFPISK